MASTLHQPTSNVHCHGCFSELAGGSFSPFPAVADGIYGEDFILPEACSDIFMVSPPECGLCVPGAGGFVDGCRCLNTADVGQTGDDANAGIRCFTSACSTPPYHITTNGDSNWAIQSQKSYAAPADHARVGKYSAEERKDRILRYLKKRNQRNFTKTIKYACRKTLADRRARVRGRFAKNNDEAGEFRSINTSPNEGCPNFDDYPNHDMQVIKEDGEEWWLQEAIENLMHNIPYCSVPQWQGGISLQ